VKRLTRRKTKNKNNKNKNKKDKNKNKNKNDKNDDEEKKPKDNGEEKPKDNGEEKPEKEENEMGEHGHDHEDNDDHQDRDTYMDDDAHAKFEEWMMGEGSVNNINVGGNFIINNGMMEGMGMGGCRPGRGRDMKKDDDDRKQREEEMFEDPEISGKVFKWAVAHFMECAHGVWMDETEGQEEDFRPDGQDYSEMVMVNGEEKKRYKITEKQFGKAFIHCALMPMMEKDMVDHEQEIRDFDPDMVEDLDLDWMDGEYDMESMMEKMMEEEDMEGDDMEGDDMEGDDMEETEMEPMP